MDSPLATTAWLEDHLDDSQIRIIDMRGGVLPPTAPPPHYFTDRAGYEEAHIPGAVFVDWQADIVKPGSPSNDVLAPGPFAELMGRLGVDDGMTVVIYDNAASMLACRLRWALRYYGHDKVKILDGGWQKWLAEGRPVNADIPAIAPASFRPRVNQQIRATADEILASLETGDMQIVDVRSPAEYAGEASRAQFGGHIPSALSLPRSHLVADDLTLKPSADLMRAFAAAGVDVAAEETVLYCNSGVSATYGMLALEIAGAQNLRIYDGSWKEWGNDASKPKATGA